METYISWAARIIIAVILLQTLFFKFTGAEESRYIFTTLMGAEYEAVGRIGSGVVELFAAILLLIPSKAAAIDRRLEELRQRAAGNGSDL